MLRDYADIAELASTSTVSACVHCSSSIFLRQRGPPPSVRRAVIGRFRGRGICGVAACSRSRRGARRHDVRRTTGLRSGGAQTFVVAARSASVRTPRRSVAGDYCRVMDSECIFCGLVRDELANWVAVEDTRSRSNRWLRTHSRRHTRWSHPGAHRVRLLGASESALRAETALPIGYAGRALPAEGRPRRERRGH